MITLFNLPLVHWPVPLPGISGELRFEHPGSFRHAKAPKDGSHVSDFDPATASHGWGLVILS